MKWSSTLGALCLCLFLGFSAKAQLSCEYQLYMYDDFGDAWNGGSLAITTGGVTNTYTLDFVNDDGTSATVAIPVSDGDEIELEYFPGFFDEEVYYALYDADGILVFSDGIIDEFFTFVMTGVTYTGTVSCPACPAISASTVGVENLRAYKTDISWIPADLAGETMVEYGLAGFTPGTGSVKIASGATTTLFNLTQKTQYEFYLSALCSNGDTSTIIGPFSFETLWANDVGVSEILSPISGCDLSFAEEVSVIIQNYGGLPQSLIPFNFSVNGVPGGVSMPQDGLYTGVVGTDSMDVADFDATFDFSEPGEYIVQAWTDLDGDSVQDNDTTTITVLSIPLVDTYPYFDPYEEWSGGWQVTATGFGLPSWEYGTPSGNMISSAASGSGAWVTNLDGTYNNNEVSYLTSPCLDFSSLTEDPRIAFNLYFDSESCCDEAWVEVSTDGGETWSKVGTAETGINWYNDNVNQWWDGTGGFDGWTYAQNILTGVAGAMDAKVRFVFSTDGSVVREGMAIDNFLIGQIPDIDLAASNVSNNSLEECGTENDQVVLRIRNVGTEPQSGFDVGYSINGGDPVVENVGAIILLPGEETIYTFNQPFNSTTSGAYLITAWSSLGNDIFALNDTVSYEYRTTVDLPFAENFESTTIPAGWVVDPDLFVTNSHNNVSFVLSDNIYSFDPNMTFTTPAYGPILADDTLRFDYRYTDFFDGIVPTILGPSDELQVQISTDCGMTYVTYFSVNQTNHVPVVGMTTVVLPLEFYEGQNIKIRFFATWGQGDYWLDIDNINIRRCPESLALSADLINPDSETTPNGAITVTPGAGDGPYSYTWNTGDSTKTINNLLAGTYKVTVTDRFGCSDILEVQLTVTGLNDLPRQIAQLQLMPNPTQGFSRVKVDFTAPVDVVRLQVLNTTGQILLEQREYRVSNSTFDIDLQNYPDGLYLIRVLADGAVTTRKLIKG